MAASERITLSLAVGNRREMRLVTVEAEQASSHFAVHESQDVLDPRGTIRLTHIKSGYAAGRFKTKYHARAAAHALEAVGPFWDFDAQTVPESFPKQCKAVIAKHGGILYGR